MRYAMKSDKEYIESRAEMEKLLTEERLGYLGMSMKDVPYVLPITYGYKNGRIIFHGSMAGKKLDYLRSNSKVCFTVCRQYGKFVPHPQGAACHANSDSVVCYGVARIIEDLEERCRTLAIFNHCLQADARDLTREEVKNCVAVEIRITEMTGREERDSKCTYREYRFAGQEE
jgi:nitroimidazol reductase NimA-like FMN-containing flavoprotein (pyridoxamine 5'-phosphate oxidase superfamily)